MTPKKIIVVSVSLALLLLLLSHFRGTQLGPGDILVPESHSRSTASQDPLADEPDADDIETDAPSKVTDNRFAVWLTAEAQRLEMNVADSEALEDDLKDIVSRFQPRHLLYLSQRSLDTGAPLTERILAAYLLTLSPGNQSLIDVASSAIENPGPHMPHTIDESRAAQERALRLMAIDAIVKRDDTYINRIHDLEKIISQTTDETVRNYALRKLDELKAQL